ncbi:hypothetical protein [Alysiella crassa]|uniref:hypothetical protein n=1 Tax=Alysiella crassa TaxID=153491 RepID=UPI001FD5680C|nr:hypothetical protein [Alysiella crassa]UOP07259.1 hypothetical protein LVJ80_02085 [Alysiella crassa]
MGTDNPIRPLLCLYSRRNKNTVQGDNAVLYFQFCDYTHKFPHTSSFITLLSRNNHVFSD